MKAGKAPGVDYITPDILKADPKATTEVLYHLLNNIWDTEVIPTEWKTSCYNQLEIFKRRNIVTTLWR